MHTLSLLAIIFIIILLLCYNNYYKEEEVCVDAKKIEGVEKYSIDYYLRLFTYYYYGSPDKYDRYDNLIPGRHPDYKRAIIAIKKSINMGFDYGYLILGMIYQYNLNDNTKALKIYNHILQNNFCIQDKERAQSHIHQINDNVLINSADDDFRSFILDELVYNGDNDANFYIDQNTLYSNDPILQPNQNELDELNNIIIDLQLVDTINWEDSQNVHDSQVISTLENSINTIQTKTTILQNSQSSYNDIVNYISLYDDSDKKYNALKALKAIKKNNTIISKFELSEMEVLRLVWNRIKSEDNEDSFTILKENLYNELVDMVQGDIVVCATGRVARLIDSLSGVDDSILIKSKYMIRDEMMTKIAKIRNNLLSIENDHDRARLESGTHTMQEEWESNFKRSIRDIFILEYVKSNILSQKEFDDELSSWIDYI